MTDTMTSQNIDLSSWETLYIYIYIYIYICMYVCMYVCVPLATEPGISLIILPLRKILQRNCNTHYRHIPFHFSHNEPTRVQIYYYIINYLLLLIYIIVSSVYIVVFYNKKATVSFCDVLGWLGISVCASSVAICDYIIVFQLPLDSFWCTRRNDFLLWGQNNVRIF